MVVRILLAILGLFFLGQGLWMLAAPGAWAESVVHLVAPDHLHFHLIADIGMAFLASGAGLLLGARRGVVFGDAFRTTGTRDDRRRRRMRKREL